MNSKENKNIITKIENIVEKQRKAFYYFQYALTRFQSVTDDLQRLLKDALLDQLDAGSSFSANIEKEYQSICNENGQDNAPARKRVQNKPKKCNEETHDKLLYVKNSLFGKSVFSLETIPKGRRVVEYAGNIYRKQMQKPTNDPYIYEFVFHGENLCIDPSSLDCKAKYIHHNDLNPNCQVKIEVVENIPKLFFYSIRDIYKNEKLSCNYLMESCRRVNLDAFLTLLEEHQNLVPFSEVFVKEEPFFDSPELEYTSVESPPIYCNIEFNKSQGELCAQSTSDDTLVEESLSQSDAEKSKWKSLTNSFAKRNATGKIVINQIGKNENNGTPTLHHEELEKNDPMEEAPIQKKKSRKQASDIGSFSNIKDKETTINKPENTSNIESQPSCSKRVTVSNRYLPDKFSPHVQPVLEGSWESPVHHKRMISQLAKEIVIFLNDEGLIESSDSIIRRKEYRLLEQELTLTYPKLVTCLGDVTEKLKHSRKGCHSDFVKKIASRRRQEKFQMNQRQRDPPPNCQNFGPEDYWTFLKKMSLNELNDAAEGKSLLNISYYLRSTFGIRQDDFPTEVPLYLMQKPHIFEELSLRMGRSILDMTDDLKSLLVSFSKDQGRREVSFVEIEEYLHESTKMLDKEGQEAHENDTSHFLELVENFNYDPALEDNRSGYSVVLCKGELYLNDMKRFHKIYGTFTETEAVLTGFGAYYIFNKEFPKRHLQFLGLLEIIVRPLGARFTEVQRSNKLIDLCKRLEI